ncbi:MAG: hypothetical protein LBC69_03625 [Eubacteriaceae bacterium]|jgi:hypothetical protein|nr:hypothetical protein [Eubacteriaceae bacterium]
MEEGLSDAWIRLMARQKDFMRAAMEYREWAGERSLKSDIMVSLDDRLGAMATIRIIRDGYISVEGIPSVWYRLIALIFESDPAIGKWIHEILTALSEPAKQELRKDAARLCDFYSARGVNEVQMLIALKLLIGLECPEGEVQAYVEKYADVFEL